MSAQKLFLIRVPDAEAAKQREAEFIKAGAVQAENQIYYRRRDRMNFRQGMIAGILATSFVLITIVAIIGLIMWMI